MADFYLASHSPRRRDLLRQIGARFETLLMRSGPPRGPDITEALRDGEAPEQYVERIAREKCENGMRAMGARSLLARPVLGADTIVIVEGKILGKPQDLAQATAFLQQLCGRTHEVRTAVALAVPGGRAATIHTSVCSSLVTLRALDAEQIARYCASGEPFDKAGGYAIQGRAAMFIEKLEGSYSGVVGLPLAETAALLARAGVRLL